MHRSWSSLRFISSAIVGSALSFGGCTSIQSTNNALTAHDECSEKYDEINDWLNADYVGDYVRCLNRASIEYGFEHRGERFKPIEDGSSISVNVNHRYHPGEMSLSNGKVLRLVQWEAIKNILPDDQSARDTIIDGFSRYWFSYDKFEDAIRVEPLRYSTGPYSRTSYVSLRGRVKNGSPDNFRLEFKYYGRNWLFADRIRVHIDGETFDIGPMNFSRDHYTMVWEIASIPLSGRGKEIAERISQGKDVEVRFVGSQYFRDFRVPQVMKDDIAAMIQALEYL